MNIVLFNPLIPQNTGSIGRLCVCTNTRLHLIEPLGFELDEKRIKKAGMDYWPHLQLTVHASWEKFLESENPQSLLFATTKSERTYFSHKFQGDDYIVFGNESHGLPPDFYQTYKEQLFTIPMDGRYARSHNLANSASIILYEGLRQLEHNDALS